MTQRAKVESVEAIKAFKAMLFKFGENASVALADAESDMTRTLHWLEHAEAVMRAKEALRQKQIFKDAVKQRQSSIEEEKLLAIAQRKLEEAEQKIAAVKRHTVRLQKEILLYKGTVQRFATSVTLDLPRAGAQLEQTIQRLEAYLGLQSPNATAVVSETSSAPGVAVRMLTPLGAAPPEWAIPVLDLWQRNALKQWVSDSDDDSQPLTVVVDLNAPKADRITLERAAPVSMTDSGWHITPVSEPSGEYLTITVKDLLAVRVDLEELLQLPQAFRAVLGKGGVESVLDSQQKELWIGITKGEA